MRSKAAPLLPVFRSRQQVDILTLLLLHPDTDYTVTEVARRLGIPLTTAHQEVRRLVEAEILTSRRAGRASLVRANPEHRALAPLTQLVTVTFGPHIIIEEEFEGVGNVWLALIYGSWAARYVGEPGPPPNDVDVLVVGDVDRQQVYDAAERAEQRLGVPVNPTVRSRSRWEAADDALVQQILSAATVTVIDHRQE
jgi:DNA-binding transcriptional ArsR family regulator